MNFYIYDNYYLKQFYCFIITLTLLIVTIIQLKKKNKILDDKKYNTMLLVSNIIILFIFLRDKFDPLIPFGFEESANFFNKLISWGMFSDYNLTFIAILFTCLLIYNLLNKPIKKKS